MNGWQLLALATLLLLMFAACAADSAAARTRAIEDQTMFAACAADSAAARTRDIEDQTVRRLEERDHQWMTGLWPPEKEEGGDSPMRRERLANEREDLLRFVRVARSIDSVRVSLTVDGGDLVVKLVSVNGAVASLWCTGDGKETPARVRSISSY